MVILEKGVYLPDGVKVAVMVEQAEQVNVVKVTPEEIEERRAVVARMREFGQKLAGRHVNLGDLILECREELENRA